MDDSIESRRAIDAQLYETLGALKATSDERREQTAELFRLVRNISSEAVTKRDFGDLRDDLNGHMARDIAEHGEFRTTIAGLSKILYDPEDDTKGLVPQVRSLEESRGQIKKLIRNAVWVTITLPPVFEALLVLWRDFIFPHLLHLHP